MANGSPQISACVICWARPSKSFPESHSISCSTLTTRRKAAENVQFYICFYSLVIIGSGIGLELVRRGILRLFNDSDIVLDARIEETYVKVQDSCRPFL